MKKICVHIIIGFMRLLALLPLRVHYALGDGLAWLMGSVFKYRRKVVEVNLLHAFPDKSPEERKAIMKGFYKHFGELVAEAVWFGGTRSLKRLHKANIVEYVGVEEHAKELEGTKGVMYLISHCGNWELFGGWFQYPPKGSLPYLEEQVIAVYKKLSSEVWDEVLARTRFWPMVGFEGYVESHNVFRFALQHPERRVFLFNTDQYPYRGAVGYEVQDFLHQPTMAMTGGPAIACKLGVAAVYANMNRVSRGHYVMSFKVLAKDASQTTPTDIVDRYYKLLQKDIEANPSNYLWTHKRWKNLYDYK
jgi:KDO2-lipid IV(A) lauroyltransferase